MERKPVRCEHCNTPITKNFPEARGEWIHYPVRKGTYKGSRFFGCHYYDPTIKYIAGVFPHKQATPKKEVPSNAEPTK